MSKGEEKIISLLKKNGYKFEREKRFKDLKHGLYRFDFCIYRKRSIILIEFQGRQHYEYTPKFHNSRIDFEKSKERDRRKISYCLARNIPLYIIPYWELGNLNTAADLFQQKFLARTKWKNDKDWQQHKI